MKKKIIRLTESEFKNVVSNTVKEVIKEEKKLISENWAVDMITQLGDFVHMNAPTIYNKILSLDNQWNGPAGSYDFTDPNILQKANQVVGKILALPASAAAVIGGSMGVNSFINKYKPQIDKLKDSFMAKSLSN